MRHLRTAACDARSVPVRGRKARPGPSAPPGRPFAAFAAFAACGVVRRRTCRTGPAMTRTAHAPGVRRGAE
ncbi:hypothetical protein NKH77_08435 [Streptomyces sp. M19]